MGDRQIYLVDGCGCGVEFDSDVDGLVLAVGLQAELVVGGVESL